MRARVSLRRLFKECPHPDEKQRGELSRRLGLDPRQVKFWFQNRRTQMKVFLPAVPIPSFFFSLP
jgi:homeobox-leucine zipper protein